MDEPFSALDVLTAETLRTDLLDLWCEGRMPIRSILMVTHNIEEAVLMCDRILVFSSNPGRVVAEIRVDLPQPRNRQDPAFRALVDDIYARMTARATDQPAREGLFPGTGLGMVLPEVSTNSFAGLIEALDATPKGEADLAKLADELHLEVDELFPIADTLQLMRFAEMEGESDPPDRRRAALCRRRSRRAQAALRPAPAGLRAARRPHPPGPGRTAAAQGARAPLPRRARGLHERGICGADPEGGHGLGPLRRSVRL